jgi:hypothetical protein
MPSGPVIRWIVDAAIVITALEVLALWVYGAPGRTRRWRAQVINVVAGLFLMLALRAALAGADWLCIGACLVSAGAAHGIDLRARLRAAD